jgi:hypothetical protein
MTAETASSLAKAHTATFLDTIWMRFIALLIAIGGIAIFVVANQDMLARVFAGGSREPSAYQLCLDERMAAVELLAKDAGYTVKQKQLAEIRAKEYCRNQTGL